MSGDLHYVLLCFVAGLLGVGAIALLGWLLDGLAPLHRRWLQYRLRRRLARGTDAYFEEQRDLESRLETLATSAGAPKPKGWRLAWLVLFAPLFGLYFVDLVFHIDTAPWWADPARGIAMPLVLGFQYTFMPSGMPKFDRTVGIIWLLVAAFQLWRAISHFR